MTQSLKVAKVIKEALAIVDKEKLEKAKKEYISKLQELDRAEKIVANIKRELNDLIIKLEQDIDA